MGTHFEEQTRDHALMQRSRWRVRGLDLDFERRLTFSPDESELRVVERVRGPREEKETAAAIRVK